MDTTRRSSQHCVLNASGRTPIPNEGDVACCVCGASSLPLRPVHVHVWMRIKFLADPDRQVCLGTVRTGVRLHAHLWPEKGCLDTERRMSLPEQVESADELASEHERCIPMHLICNLVIPHISTHLKRKHGVRRLGQNILMHHGHNRSKSKIFLPQSSSMRTTSNSCRTAATMRNSRAP